VTVTFGFEGTESGAVYVTPVVELFDSAPAPVKDQLTPALVESPTTVAVKLNVAPGAMVEDCPLIVTTGTFEPPPPPPHAARIERKLIASKQNRGRMGFTSSPLKTPKVCG
jgi:hypothetical protein